MFTKIHLENFRSFDIIDFNIIEKSNEAKRLAIIYGENGSGKSNLMSAFYLLDELINTMNLRDHYNRLLAQSSVFSDEKIQLQYQQELAKGFRDMKALVEDYKMVDCDKPVIATYEFTIGKCTGTYHIELEESEIILERLEYKISKRKGLYFEYNKNNMYINPKIVTNKSLLKDIKESAKRFWGKHSIFAIITHEIEDKSDSYGKDCITSNFDDVLDEFSSISCKLGIGEIEYEQLNAPIYMLRHPIKGRIPLAKEKHLDIVESIFSRFFSSINSNIKEVKYKRSYTDKYIDYNLFIVRMLSDSYRNIDFCKESCGNHQLLTLLCYLLTAAFGYTVILDEADSGIHDLLFAKIIRELSKCIIYGQIIMTTHNTMLMETDIDMGTFYILSEEPGCHKNIRSISDYEKRTYLANNIRKKYLNNEYAGLPIVDNINLQDLIDRFANEWGKI